MSIIHPPILANLQLSYPMKQTKEAACSREGVRLSNRIKRAGDADPGSLF
jgi:hypothetical protein